MPYRLTVRNIGPSCLFDLTWGQSQQLTATLPYPMQLDALYQAWQKTYLSYYHNALRGRPGIAGKVTAPVNWHSQLAQAEAKLLSEFHRWLQQGELFQLRTALLSALSKTEATVDLFLTCQSMELARLPWETWEVGAESGGAARLRLSRSPANVEATISPRRQLRQGKPRFLVILGDATGLNLTQDRAALESLQSLATVQFWSSDPKQAAGELRESLAQAIADPLGWDGLIFAGHSGEASAVGGEIQIAPRVSLSLRELTGYVQQAGNRGLQFALFNSCCGLDIANSLIKLGLSQVVMMREQVHDQVAAAFLLQFLRGLLRQLDVHEALLEARRYLQSEKHLTYPQLN
ncbi:MAG: CHAT domain-containing protein [Leptolyngbya sp. SIO4C5]|nr:CHAT domain-containing protein [Leptolyngbya sp. SIO4C5]